MNILRRQPKMILRLDDLSTLNDELVEARNLTKADRGYAYDHDMEMLLDDSGITVGNKIDVERELQYDND